jgi:hypothetical protein
LTLHREQRGSLKLSAVVVEAADQHRPPDVLHHVEENERHDHHSQDFVEGSERQ